MFVFFTVLFVILNLAVFLYSILQYKQACLQYAQLRWCLNRSVCDLSEMKPLMSNRPFNLRLISLTLYFNLKSIIDYDIAQQGIKPLILVCLILLKAKINPSSSKLTGLIIK